MGRSKEPDGRSPCARLRTRCSLASDDHCALGIVLGRKKSFGEGEMRCALWVTAGETWAQGKASLRKFCLGSALNEG